MIVEIDAANQILGRLAAKAVSILRGKNSEKFLPNKVAAGQVLIYNVDKLKVSGKKFTDKKYYSHSGRLGHLRTKTFQEIFAKDPKKILIHAIAGMLPKNKLRSQWLKKLIIIKGQRHVNP